MGNKATFGRIITSSGTYPILMSSPFGWAYTEGVQPSTGLFDMTPDMAKAIANADAKTPVTLEFGTDKKTVTIKELWVDGIRPGPNKFIFQIRLSDRRRFLKYAIVTSRYNIKREIGVKRIKNNAELTLQDVVPSVWYAAYSLKNPTVFPQTLDNKWKPLEMFRDVHKKATEAEKRYRGGDTPPLIINSDVQALEGKMAVEDLEVNDSGDTALDRASRALPGAAITVDKDGNYVLFNRASGAEVGIVQSLGKDIANMGHVEMVDNKNECPKEIEVFWPVESELRFDFIENEDGTQTEIVDGRQLENVAPVPDFELSSGDGTLAQGVYKRLTSLLGLWGTPPGIGGTSLRTSTIRKMIPGYVDLEAALQLAGLRDPDADWLARLATIRAHYRLTFQIPPRWLDRMLTFRPFRVGVADIVSQTRGSSEAYCDWHRMSTLRSMLKNKTQRKELEYAMNVLGYPQGGQVGWGISGAKMFDGNTRPAPAEVRVVDHDLGIIHLAFRTDQFRIYEGAGPSRIVLSDGSAYNGPTADFSMADDTPVTFDMVSSTSRVPELERNFKMAVIVTAVPASPNDLRQYYKITIKPDDVRDLLPSSAKAWLDKARGPVWQARVAPGMNGGFAMLRWHDERWADFEKLFGIQEGEPNLEGLIVNRNTTEVSKDLTAPNLDMVSRALAARIWGRFADHMQGSMAGYLNPEARLDGWIAGLVHHVDPRGVATTSVGLPDTLPVFPFESLLDSATRAILEREALPSK